MSTKTAVSFNVGGSTYQVSRSLLSLYPTTMLSRIASEQWHKDGSEIYLDRNSSRFQYVLDYLRDGKVYLPMTECKEAIISELEYFNIDFEADCIRHSSQGQAVEGLQIVQNTILKWRCADLAADCMEAAWVDAKWRGHKKYLSFKPHRFKETCHNMNQKDVMKITNEHLLTLGVELTSMEFDLSNEKCRVTMKLIDYSC